MANSSKEGCKYIDMLQVYKYVFLFRIMNSLTPKFEFSKLLSVMSSGSNPNQEIQFIQVPHLFLIVYHQTDPKRDYCYSWVVGYKFWWGSNVECLMKTFYIRSPPKNEVFTKMSANTNHKRSDKRKLNIWLKNTQIQFKTTCQRNVENLWMKCVQIQTEGRILLEEMHEILRHWVEMHYNAPPAS